MMLHSSILSSKQQKPSELLTKLEETLAALSKASILGIEAYPSSSEANFIHGIAIASNEYGCFFDLESYAFNRITHREYYSKLFEYIKANADKLYSFEYKQTLSLLYRLLGESLPIKSTKALAIIKGSKGELKESYRQHLGELPQIEFCPEVLNAYLSCLLAKKLCEDISEAASAVYLANQQLGVSLSMSPMQIDLEALQTLYRQSATIAFNGSLFLNYLAIVLQQEQEEIPANEKLIKLVGYYGFSQCLAEPKTLAANFGDFVRKHKEIFNEVITVYRDELQFLISITDARWKTQKAKQKVLANIAEMLDKEWELSKLREYRYLPQEELNKILAIEALKQVVPLQRQCDNPPVRNLEAYANIKPETYKQLCKRITAIAKELCNDGTLKTPWPDNWSEELPWFLKTETDVLYPLLKVVLPDYKSYNKVQLISFVLDAVLKLKEAHNNLRIYKQICNNLYKGKKSNGLYILDKGQGNLFQTEYNVNTTVTNRWSSNAHNMISANSAWKKVFIPFKGTKFSVAAEDYDKVENTMLIGENTYREDDLVKLVDGWCIAKEFLQEYQIATCQNSLEPVSIQTDGNEAVSEEEN